MPVRIARPRVHAVGPMLLITLLIASLAPAATVTAAATTSFVANADASVRLRSPNGNYGSADYLRLREAVKDAWRAYVRFTVGPLDGPVSGALLRLWVTDAGPDGGEIYAVDPAWSESSITWATAPPISGTHLDTIGAVSVGTWAEFDVSAAVTGPGTYAFALRSTSGNSVLYASREGVAPPELIVTTEPVPTPPVASFTGTPSDGLAPLTVAFTDSSTGSPTAWAWDFESDGTVDSTEPDPTHTYPTPGLYSVTLTVSNSGGSDTLVLSDFVTVDAPPPAPVADFSAVPVTGEAPLTVAFTDSSTGSPTAWAWDFESDGTVDSTEPDPTHTYPTPGLYSVTLTVSNAGGSDTLARTDLVTVSAPGGATLRFAPVADAHVRSGGPTSNYGTATTLRLRNASDSYRAYLKFLVNGITSPVVSATLRLYVTDPSWAGGDVYVTDTNWTELGITAGNAPAFHGPALDSVGSVVAGTWVELDVTASITADGTFAYGMDTPAGDSVLYSSKEGVQPPELVIVTSSSGTPPPPTADFSAAPTNGGAPLIVKFRDESVGIPQSWAWDFQGDGIVDSTSRNPTFMYTAPGTYDVRLTVTNAGGSSTLTKVGLIAAAAPPPPGAGDAVLVGAGDIADCGSSGDEATASLLDGIPGTVFTAGDNVYETGTTRELANCYDPSWGRHRARTRPSLGNHDYGTSGAAPYFAYFGSNAGEPGKGYYSYDLGDWHVVVLNSNCGEVGGCGTGSPQETWLRADLAASSKSCTVAYWHHPLFSSAQTSGTSSVQALWLALEDGGAELVLNGHAHVYERFAPQTASGVASPTGIRQFTVGTGGKSLSSFGTIRLNSEVRSNLTYGVLKLTLRATGYLWEFVPVAGWSGAPIDAGSAYCH
jgi:PKD repeat protein